MLESMRPVDIGAVTLGVVEAGAGPAVVFVHGFPELAYSWLHQLPALAAGGYRAIAYDGRGYGASDHPADVPAYRLEVLMADLVALLDALDVDRATLVGHDWGSIVVWSAAVMESDRVDRVVSLNVPYRGWCCGFPPTPFIRENLADRFGYVLAFQEPGAEERRFAADPEGWLRRVYHGVAGRDGFQSDDEFRVYLDAFTKAGLTGPLNYYRNIDANREATVPLADAEIRPPTLMIAADVDPVLPVALVRGMDRWVPDLRTEVIAHCGHWTQQEQPTEVNRLLLDFLGERAQS